MSTSATSPLNSVNVTSFLVERSTPNIVNPELKLITVAKFDSREHAIALKDYIVTEQSGLLGFGTKLVVSQEHVTAVKKYLQPDQVENLVEPQRLSGFWTSVSSETAERKRNQKTYTRQELVSQLVQQPEYFTHYVFVIPSYTTTDKDLDLLKTSIQLPIEFVGDINDVNNIVNIDKVKQYFSNSMQTGGKRQQKRQSKRSSPKIHVGTRGGKYYIKNGKKVYV
jgi:hypothetical protein